MASLWLTDSTEQWAVAELTVDAIALQAQDGGGVSLRDAGPNSVPDAGLVVRHLRPSDGNDDIWVLCGPMDADVRVNEMPFVGLRVLAHMDQICIGRSTVFFSAERLARVATAPDAPEEPLACPRCHRVIAAGSPGVCCPKCGVWHHETKEDNCWTYAEFCACGCGQSTNLSAGYRWSPAEL
jgi:hypothetical protein